jgi:hypothetical protein
MALWLFMIMALENSSSFFRGKASVRYNRPISVPQFAVQHYVRLCGVAESSFLRNGIPCHRQNRALMKKTLKKMME